MDGIRMEANSKIILRPIGIIHSPFREPRGTPIQSADARDVRGTIEVFHEYTRGLKDVEGFSHIIVVSHFHLSGEATLELRPYLDDQTRGVFATRAPAHPNPIGISVVRLDRVDRNVLHIRGVDMVDGTPLIDIKPYVPEFDARAAERIGWLGGNIHKLPGSRDDGRFVK